MRKAKLKILGLKVPIGLSKTYHDDGFVDSISDHSLKLNKKYMHWVTEQEYVKLCSCGGICEVINGFSKEHCFIYYQKGLSPEVAIKIRAHEETHALEFFGCLDALAEKILDEQRVNIDLRRIGDTEVIANIGSIYALFAHNIYPAYVNAIPLHPSFVKAREIYEQSRLE